MIWYITGVIGGALDLSVLYCILSDAFTWPRLQDRIWPPDYEPVTYMNIETRELLDRMTP